MVKARVEKIAVEKIRIAVVFEIVQSNDVAAVSKRIFTQYIRRGEMLLRAAGDDEHILPAIGFKRKERSRSIAHIAIEHDAAERESGEKIEITITVNIGKRRRAGKFARDFLIGGI